jgi:hypothetical protein
MAIDDLLPARKINHTTAQTDDHKLAQRSRNDPQGTDSTTDHGECAEGMRRDPEGPSITVHPNEISLGLTFDHRVLRFKHKGLNYIEV